MDPSKLSPAYLAEDNSSPLLATCIFFLTIETIFIALMYTSRILSKDQRTNLWMTILMTIGYSICVGKITIGFLLISIGGAGHHLPSLTPTRITNTLKLQTALQIICPLTTSLTKLSILCLLHSILGRTSQRARVVIKATFGLVFAVLIIQVIIPFANCRPFAHNWEPFGPGHCAFSGLSLWRYLSIPNVVTTFIMICIPLPALYRLRVSVPTKLGLGLVFSVCLLGIVAAVMRFVSFLQVENFNDITYEMIGPLSWTIAESGIYLVAGVMPTLRPLVRKVGGSVDFEKVLSRTFGWSRSSSKKTEESWGNKDARRLAGGKPLPAVPGTTKSSIKITVDDWDDDSSVKGLRDDGRRSLSDADKNTIAMLERGERATET